MAATNVYRDRDLKVGCLEGAVRLEYYVVGKAEPNCEEFLCTEVL